MKNDDRLDLVVVCVEFLSKIGGYGDIAQDLFSSWFQLDQKANWVSKSFIVETAMEVLEDHMSNVENFASDDMSQETYRFIYFVSLILRQYMDWLRKNHNLKSCRDLTIVLELIKDWAFIIQDYREIFQTNIPKDCFAEIEINLCKIYRYIIFVFGKIPDFNGEDNGVNIFLVKKKERLLDK